MNTILSTIFYLLFIISGTQAKDSRHSTIRSDLKTLIRYTKLEINVFVDTCTSSGEFEKVVLNLFPAVEVLRLKMHADIRVRTKGKTLTVLLGEKTRDVTFLVEDHSSDGEEGEEEEEEASVTTLNTPTSNSTKEKIMVNKTVTITTLDEMLADNGYSSTCPEFVRITDYGGNELSVLQGARTTLACAKIICVSGNIMRLNDHMPFAADVISFANDHGFAIYNTYENQRMRFFNVQVEILFVKKEIMDEMFEVGFKDHMT